MFEILIGAELSLVYPDVVTLPAGCVLVRVLLDPLPGSVHLFQVLDEGGEAAFFSTPETGTE